MTRTAIVLLLAAVTGCAEPEYAVQHTPPAAGDLTITGRVCDPVLGRWLPDALVYTHLYDDSDVVYDTRQATTDEDGFYTLDEILGGRDYELYVQKGQDILEQFVVSVAKDEDLDVPPVACAGLDVDAAVISGAHDELDPVLDALGVTSVHVVDGQSANEIVDFLADPANLSEFEIVFFDGGHIEDGVIYGQGPTQQVLDTVRAYVDGGGTVFATDWAYDVVERAWPTRIDFAGDDTVPDAAQMGEMGAVDAEVVDPGLITALGMDRVQISYDLTLWPLIEGLDTTTRILLRGDAAFRNGFSVGSRPNTPLLVQFEQGAGQVIFSSYRQESNSGGDALGILQTLVEAVEQR